MYTIAELTAAKDAIPKNPVTPKNPQIIPIITATTCRAQ